MKRRLICTGDKSHTIFIPELNATYHSTYGAIQESNHIFIKNGFNCISGNRICILEIGFGTGLNCFLTLLEAMKKNKTVVYHGVDTYKLELDLVKKLNYTMLLSPNKQKLFENLHLPTTWNKNQKISENFNLVKINKSFLDCHFESNYYDLVYFDAFSPDVQPELWHKDSFAKISQSMKSKAFLLTYSSKGIVKRNLKINNFDVKRLVGPMGKRHIVRAQKA